MFRWLLKNIARFFPRRTIMNRDGTAPYLDRWYLLGAPRMPDGSWPFDDDGSPRPGIVWHDGLGQYLHRFHASDSDRAPHNHPFKWSVSLILSGGYVEERVCFLPDGRRYSRIRHLRPGMVNFIRANDYHRVHLVREDAWTLFLVGPKTQGWGFLEESGEHVPWEEYYRRVGRNPGFARAYPGEKP